VMQSVTMFIERRLRLKVNREKSVVCHPSILWTYLVQNIPLSTEAFGRRTGCKTEITI
jgi:hypothetical protein